MNCSSNSITITPNNLVPHLITTDLTTGATAGIVVGLLVFALILIVFFCVYKSGRIRKVYVTPGNRRSIFALPEGFDPKMMNLFGESFDKIIFGRNEMDDIPFGVGPASTSENFYNISSMDEKAYGTKPTKSTKDNHTDRRAYGSEPPKPTMNNYMIESAYGSEPRTPPTMNNYMVESAYGSEPPMPPTMNNYVIESAYGSEPPMPPTTDYRYDENAYDTRPPMPPMVNNYKRGLEPGISSKAL
jgi:hypothetical protein